ncbi:microtubule-associated protein futsch-like [Trichomycterus rosablanca]|uniref:microtubule-associated protein futsch-like n=1 Tax=Trichomycterus rosablanca TaxID=2290929 RepID=UPI002F351DB9
MVAGMLMPLNHLRAIYERLFRDGVMVAKKDKRPQTMHPEIPGVQNLQVIRVMGSLKSRGLVRETFAWRHFYWYLTNEGIVYLRDYLHLPAEIVPTPLQRVRRPAATLSIVQRAAKVQTVEGPTSYVPKVGRESAENQERQEYRRRRTHTEEEAMPSDKTSRFRGRPIAGDHIKSSASWESKDQVRGMSHYSQEVTYSAVRKTTTDTTSYWTSGKPSNAQSQMKMVSQNYTVSGETALKADTPKAMLSAKIPAQIAAASVAATGAMMVAMSQHETPKLKEKASATIHQELTSDGFLLSSSKKQVKRTMKTAETKNVVEHLVKDESTSSAKAYSALLEEVKPKSKAITLDLEKSENVKVKMENELLITSSTSAGSHVLKKNTDTTVIKKEVAVAATNAGKLKDELSIREPSRTASVPSTTTKLEEKTLKDSTVQPVEVKPKSKIIIDAEKSVDKSIEEMKKKEPLSKSAGSTLARVSEDKTNEDKTAISDAVALEATIPPSKEGKPKEEFTAVIQQELITKQETKGSSVPSFPKKQVEDTLKYTKSKGVSTETISTSTASHSQSVELKPTTSKQVNKDAPELIEVVSAKVQKEPCPQVIDPLKATEKNNADEHQVKDEMCKNTETIFTSSASAIQHIELKPKAKVVTDVDLEKSKNTKKIKDISGFSGAPVIEENKDKTEKSDTVAVTSTMSSSNDGSTTVQQELIVSTSVMETNVPPSTNKQKKKTPKIKETKNVQEHPVEQEISKDAEIIPTLTSDVQKTELKPQSKTITVIKSAVETNMSSSPQKEVEETPKNTETRVPQEHPVKEGTTKNIETTPTMSAYQSVEEKPSKVAPVSKKNKGTTVMKEAGVVGTLLASRTSDILEEGIFANVQQDTCVSQTSEDTSPHSSSEEQKQETSNTTENKTVQKQSDKNETPQNIDSITISSASSVQQIELQPKAKVVTDVDLEKSKNTKKIEDISGFSGAPVIEENKDKTKKSDTVAVTSTVSSSNDGSPTVQQELMVSTSVMETNVLSSSKKQKKKAPKTKETKNVHEHPVKKESSNDAEIISTSTSDVQKTELKPQSEAIPDVDNKDKKTKDQVSASVDSAVPPVSKKNKETTVKKEAGVVGTLLPSRESDIPKEEISANVQQDTCVSQTSEDTSPHSASEEQKQETTNATENKTVQKQSEKNEMSQNTQSIFTSSASAVQQIELQPKTADITDVDLEKSKNTKKIEDISGFSGAPVIEEIKDKTEKSDTLAVTSIVSSSSDGSTTVQQELIISTSVMETNVPPSTKKQKKKTPKTKETKNVQEHPVEKETSNDAEIVRTLTSDVQKTELKPQSEAIPIIKTAVETNMSSSPQKEVEETPKNTETRVSQEHPVMVETTKNVATKSTMSAIQSVEEKPSKVVPVSKKNKETTVIKEAGVVGTLLPSRTSDIPKEGISANVQQDTCVSQTSEDTSPHFSSEEQKQEISNTTENKTVQKQSDKNEIPQSTESITISSASSVQQKELQPKTADITDVDLEKSKNTKKIEDISGSSGAPVIEENKDKTEKSDTVAVTSNVSSSNDGSTTVQQELIVSTSVMETNVPPSTNKQKKKTPKTKETKNVQERPVEKEISNDAEIISTSTSDVQKTELKPQSKTITVIKSAVETNMSSSLQKELEKTPKNTETRDAQEHPVKEETTKNIETTSTTSAIQSVEEKPSKVAPVYKKNKGTTVIKEAGVVATLSPSRTSDIPKEEISPNVQQDTCVSQTSEDTSPHSSSEEQKQETSNTTENKTVQKQSDKNEMPQNTESITISSASSVQQLELQPKAKVVTDVDLEKSKNTKKINDISGSSGAPVIDENKDKTEKSDTVAVTTTVSSSNDGSTTVQQELIVSTSVMETNVPPSTKKQKKKTPKTKETKNVQERPVEKEISNDAEIISTSTSDVQKTELKTQSKTITVIKSAVETNMSSSPQKEVEKTPKNTETRDAQEHPVKEETTKNIETTSTTSAIQSVEEKPSKVAPVYKKNKGTTVIKEAGVVATLSPSRTSDIPKEEISPNVQQDTCVSQTSEDTSPHSSSEEQKQETSNTNENKTVQKQSDKNEMPQNTESITISSASSVQQLELQPKAKVVTDVDLEKSKNTKKIEDISGSSGAPVIDENKDKTEKSDTVAVTTTVSSSNDGSTTVQQELMVSTSVTETNVPLSSKKQKKKTPKTKETKNVQERPVEKETSNDAEIIPTSTSDVQKTELKPQSETIPIIKSAVETNMSSSPQKEVEETPKNTETRVAQEHPVKVENTKNVETTPTMSAIQSVEEKPSKVAPVSKKNKGTTVMKEAGVVGSLLPFRKSDVLEEEIPANVQQETCVSQTSEDTSPHSSSEEQKQETLNTIENKTAQKQSDKNEMPQNTGSITTSSASDITDVGLEKCKKTMEIKKSCRSSGFLDSAVTEKNNDKTLVNNTVAESTAIPPCKEVCATVQQELTMIKSAVETNMSSSPQKEVKETPIIQEHPVKEETTKNIEINIETTPTMSAIQPVEEKPSMEPPVSKKKKKTKTGMKDVAAVPSANLPSEASKHEEESSTVGQQELTISKQYKDTHVPSSSEEKTKNVQDSSLQNEMIKNTETILTSNVTPMELKAKSKDVSYLGSSSKHLQEKDSAVPPAPKKNEGTTEITDVAETVKEKAVVNIVQQTSKTSLEEIATKPGTESEKPPTETLTLETSIVLKSKKSQKTTTIKEIKDTQVTLEEIPYEVTSTIATKESDLSLAPEISDVANVTQKKVTIHKKITIVEQTTTSTKAIEVTKPELTSAEETLIESSDKDLDKKKINVAPKPSKRKGKKRLIVKLSPNMVLNHL